MIQRAREACSSRPKLDMIPKIACQICMMAPRIMLAVYRAASRKCSLLSSYKTEVGMSRLINLFIMKKYIRLNLTGIIAPGIIMMPMTMPSMKIRVFLVAMEMHLIVG